MASHPGSIPAGGKDKISVVVDTVQRGGQGLHKRFVVSTNDPKYARIQLAIKGKVGAFASIEPPYVRLSGREGEAIFATVRIRPEAAFPFVITGVKASGKDNIRMDLQPLGDHPAKDGYQLVITSLQTEVGTFRDAISIHTDLKQKPIFYLPVSARIRSAAGPAPAGPRTAQ